MSIYSKNPCYITIWKSIQNMRDASVNTHTFAASGKANDIGNA